LCRTFRRCRRFQRTLNGQNSSAEQIVGRERNQRACQRQLVRNAVASRRVNSDVRPHEGQRVAVLNRSELSSGTRGHNQIAENGSVRLWRSVASS
jgi:hypothetical protein